MKAVVLLSGGLDSATILAGLLANGLEPSAVHALAVDYGQRHSVELHAAERLAAHYSVALKVAHLPVNYLGGLTPLTGGKGVLGTGVVPGRNSFFLAAALVIAQSNQANEIYIGANRDDYEDYPDCRPQFLEASLSAGYPISLVAPLINMRKHEVVRKAIELGVPIQYTHTCYDPIINKSVLACGECASCHLRQDAFAQAGEVDPVAVRF